MVDVAATCSDRFQQLSVGVTVEVPQLQFIDSVRASSLNRDRHSGSKLWRRFQRSSSWTRSLWRSWKNHDFLREGEPGSRVAPGRWTLFLRACIWQRNLSHLRQSTAFGKFHNFYVDSAGCSHMEIWTLFQRAFRMTG